MKNSEKVQIELCNQMLILVAMGKTSQNQSLKLLRKARLEHVRQVASRGKAPVRQPVDVPAAPVRPAVVLPANVRPASEQPKVAPKRRDVLIYESELLRIVRLCHEYDGIETDWHLFGTSTASGVPVVEYVLDCGPNAVHEVAFCKPDVAYLTREGNRLVNRYGLCHIGAGHSHHRLGLNEPSGFDVKTTVTGMREAGMRRFVQMIVTYGDGIKSTRINPFMFDSDGYERMNIQVLHGTSPVRKMEENNR